MCGRQERLTLMPRLDEARGERLRADTVGDAPRACGERAEERAVAKAEAEASRASGVQRTCNGRGPEAGR